MSAPKLYTLSNCDTCRRAVKWLRSRGVAFEERAIRETPPSVAELRKVLAGVAGEISRLCNTSGREYRAEKLGERIPSLSTTAVLELLAKNGSLIKRPLLIGDSVALVGFQEAAWSAAFESK